MTLHQNQPSDQLFQQFRTMRDQAVSGNQVVAICLTEDAQLRSLPIPSDRVDQIEGGRIQPYLREQLGGVYWTLGFIDPKNLKRFDTIVDSNLVTAYQARLDHVNRQQQTAHAGTSSGVGSTERQPAMAGAAGVTADENKTEESKDNKDKIESGKRKQ